MSLEIDKMVEDVLAKFAPKEPAMKTYEIDLEVTRTESFNYFIEAESEKEARELAIEYGNDEELVHGDSVIEIWGVELVSEQDEVEEEVYKDDPNQIGLIWRR